ncbi:MAG: spheroidene monooxygenase [Streptomycetaceae bacterium]|nr:MAG: spheroidene monooxygenase [Streptomycetaceae bacterium]
MIVAYFWKIKPSAVPFAFVAMALDRFILRSSSNVGFFKSLGTGKGETFTPMDANPLRWGLIAEVNDIDAFDNSFVIRQWRRNSTSEFRAVIEAISSHGKWAGYEPFVPSVKEWDGQVIAITRARIAWLQNLRFWRAVPPVTASLKSAPGLVAAIGIGEAPIGLQGTFSIWESPTALRNFAYRGDAHNAAIEATKKYNWYSEELFSRFAVRDMRGSIND